MRSIATISADLDKLRALRARGRKSVRFGDRAMEIKSDAELAGAIAALEGELEQATASPRARTIVVRSPPMKGW